MSPDANVSTGNSVASYGNGNAAAVGGTSTSYNSGDTVIDPAGANDNSAWQAGAFPGQTSNNKSAGVKFTVSTLGWQNIRIAWQQRASANASKYSRLQYSTNGTDFLDYPAAITISTANNFENKSNNLTGIAFINNRSTFAFRIVTEFESTATGAGNARYVPVSGGSYSSGGQISFDMVTVYGDPLPQEVSLGSPILTNGNVFKFTVNGQLGVSYVVQATTNISPAIWISIQTNIAPFTYTETNLFIYPQRYFKASPIN